MENHGLPALPRHGTRPGVFMLAAICAAFASAPVLAINIVGEGPDSATGIFDRFNLGTYLGTPTANPSFFASSLDLSGIGWVASNPTQSITLVSPQFFVGASHYFPGLGSTLQFAGTDGAVYSAIVAESQRLIYSGSNGPQLSDLTIGRLSTALPSVVTPMPIFYMGDTSVSNPSSFNAYGGFTLLNYGRTARMGVNEVDYFTEFSFGGPKTDVGLVYTQGTGFGQTLLESGDSGSPSLAYLDGIYGLIGTHSGVNTANALSVDAFVSYTDYVSQMNTFMQPYDESLTLAGVPEPGSLIFGIALFGVCAAHRVRRAPQAWGS